MNLCAAGAWKVEFVVACIDDTLAAPDGQQAQNAGNIGWSVNRGSRVCAQQGCSVRGLKGDWKRAIEGALLRTFANASDQQWSVTFVLLGSVAVLLGFNCYTLCPGCTCQVANRA